MFVYSHQILCTYINTYKRLDLNIFISNNFVIHLALTVDMKCLACLICRKIIIKRLSPSRLLLLLCQDSVIQINLNSVYYTLTNFSSRRWCWFKLCYAWDTFLYLFVHKLSLSSIWKVNT